MEEKKFDREGHIIQLLREEIEGQWKMHKQQVSRLECEVKKLKKAKQLANARADAAERRARQWRDVAETALASLAELVELSGVAKP